MVLLNEMRVKPYKQGCQKKVPAGRLAFVREQRGSYSRRALLLSSALSSLAWLRDRLQPFFDILGYCRVTKSPIFLRLWGGAP